MTLQNGAVVGKRAILWCDTAYYTGDGATLTGYAPNAFYGLEWSFAVSWSTIGGDPNQFARQVAADAPQSLHDLLGCCRNVLLAFCASEGTMGRLLVAAHDRETDKARLFMLASEVLWEHPAFTPIECISFVSSHNDSAPHQAALAAGFTVARMLEVIDAQRASPYETALGRAAQVGGNCVQIEVTKRGVTSSVAREWNDDPAAMLH